MTAIGSVMRPPPSRAELRQAGSSGQHTKRRAQATFDTPHHLSSGLRRYVEPDLWYGCLSDLASCLIGGIAPVFNRASFTGRSSSGSSRPILTGHTESYGARLR